MRTIKFRGKSVKSGEWLYGDYCNNRGVDYILPREVLYAPALTEDFEVDPTTVGQFTGVQDITGVDIYEGDIVRVCSKRKPNGGYTTSGAHVIVFDDRYATFVEQNAAQWRHGRPGGSHLCAKKRPNVLGNIFDNAERLTKRQDHNDNDDNN